MVKDVTTNRCDQSPNNYSHPSVHESMKVCQMIKRSPHYLHCKMYQKVFHNLLFSFIVVYLYAHYYITFKYTCNCILGQRHSLITPR